MVDKSKKQDFSIKQAEEVDKNYEYFQALLKKGDLNHKYGKFALLKNKKILDYFDTRDDAKRCASIACEDGVFSIQKVSNEVDNLGFLSYAVI